MSFDPPASGSFPQAPPAPSLIGEVLDGRYKIFKKLGEGGMGEVYAADHVHIDKRFAVKLLKAEIVSNAEAVKRFQQEARSASSIKHRNIIGVEDFGRLPDGRIYMCMEFLAGSPLNEMIQHPMGADRLLNILIQSGHGLAAAHAKGIVHRDMKPENIYVTQEGNPPNDVPKLLDFGIAKVAGNEGQNNLTRTGTIFGTPFYMAPEQALGNPVDARTDIYAMGVIMYECFAGSLPFQGESFMGILTQHITAAPEPVAQRAAKAGRTLPMGVAEIITRCLDKDPAGRPQSMDELVNALIPIYRSIAGAGMSTYMEAFPVGSAQHASQATPGPMMAGRVATNQSATVAAHTPPPYVPGQSQPMMPMQHGGPPSGQGAALGTSGMYDPGASSIAPPKSKTGLIVALVILLAAGGGIAAVVVLGAKGKKTDPVAEGGGSGSAVVADNGGGSATVPDKGSAGTTPDVGSAAIPDKGSAAVIPDNGSAGSGSDATVVNAGSGSNAAGSGGTTPPDSGSGSGSNTVVVDTAPKSVQVLVMVSNVAKFDTYEGLTKFPSKGANNVTVTLGKPRTLTLKARGYKPTTVTLDGKETTVSVALEAKGGGGNTGNTGSNTTVVTPPAKKDCAKEILDPKSDTCRRQYCKTHSGDARCLSLDDAATSFERPSAGRVDAVRSEDAPEPELRAMGLRRDDELDLAGLSFGRRGARHGHRQGSHDGRRRSVRTRVTRKQRGDVDRRHATRRTGAPREGC